MLKKVGEQLLAGQGHIGLHVVGKVLEHQVVAFFGQQGLGHQHNVLVGKRRDAHHNVFGSQGGGGHEQQQNQ